MTVRGCTLLLVLGTAATIGLPLAVRAQQGVDEYRLKAAIIRQFGTYVTWPAGFEPAGPKHFVIGVVGKNPFAKEDLEDLAKRTVGDKKIVIHRFETTAEVKPCHLLFLAAEAAAPENNLTAAQRLTELRKKVVGTPMLLVSDTTGLARKGSMINIYLENDRAKFEINHGEAKRAGLVISSKLLQLGTVITTDKD